MKMYYSKNHGALRKLYWLGFVSASALLLTALYFQHVDGLEPCPLCIFQRVAFIAMAIFFLISALLPPGSIAVMISNVLNIISGLVGCAIAARHVWLQNLPADQVPECGPGLSYMMKAFPFAQMLETVFKGSGECAEVSWRFLGLTMPGWSLVWLLALTLLVCLGIKQWRQLRRGF